MKPRLLGIGKTFPADFSEQYDAVMGLPFF